MTDTRNTNETSAASATTGGEAEATGDLASPSTEPQPNPGEPTPELVALKPLAERLGVSVSTVWSWAVKGIRVGSTPVTHASFHDADSAIYREPAP